MREVTKFKPLWQIHNSTYRRYAKGCLAKRFKRYYGKLRAVAGLLLRPILHRGRR